MKSGTQTTIVLRNEKIEATYIGSGRHAKAYRVKDDVFLFVRDCLMKEAIAGIEHPHVPVLKHVENKNEVGIWMMPFYEPLTAKNRAAWSQYRELKRCASEAVPRVINSNPKMHHADLGYMMARHVCENADVNATLRSALDEMIEKAKDYGEGISFEFDKRNLGIDEEGRLVLRDVLYDRRLICESKGRTRRL